MYYLEHGNTICMIKRKQNRAGAYKWVTTIWKLPFLSLFYAISFKASHFIKPEQIWKKKQKKKKKQQQQKNTHIKTL